jgi:hypothetical protein
MRVIDRLCSNNFLGLGAILLLVVLLSGISFVPAIYVGATVQQQQQPQQQQPSMAGKGMGPGVNGGGPSQQRSQDGSVPGSQTEQPEQSLDDIDLVRTREITAKAMTAILLLLLKWLRLSREYTRYQRQHSEP